MLELWTVEGPKKRKRCDFSSWARVVERDGSTVAYVPSVVYAQIFSATQLLLAVCQEIADDPRCDLVDSERRIRLYNALEKALPKEGNNANE